MDTASIPGIAELLARVAEEADPAATAFVYDGDSDTLMVHLFGRGIPATSVPITDEVMIRYDRAERRVVGVQFAHFLSKVAREHPIFLSLLDIAELRDISGADVARLRREIAFEQRRAVMDQAFGDLSHLTSVAD